MKLEVLVGSVCGLAFGNALSFVISGAWMSPDFCIGWLGATLLAVLVISNE